MKYTTPYIPPILTVDAVLFRLGEKSLEVLLLKRPNEPFRGEWALPGGYNARGETTLEALQRVVWRKTGVNIVTDLRHIEQLYTFDLVDRDPRGHAVSVTYMGGSRNIEPRDTGAEVRFFPVGEVPDLAYDHAEIIRYARERLVSKLAYTNIVAAFLPDSFTLTQLQSAYETISGRTFDKRNFRKKFLSLNLIHETGNSWRDGAHRPAKLYEFNSKTVENLPVQF